ncbi:MAG: hypothetical protein ABIF04_08415 [Chloroflexota bacterium]
MNVSIPSTPRILTQKKLPKPERVEGVHLQEQVTGLTPECNERPVADILAERLAESGSISHAVPIFVP